MRHAAASRQARRPRRALDGFDPIFTNPYIDARLADFCAGENFTAALWIGETIGNMSGGSTLTRWKRKSVAVGTRPPHRELDRVGHCPRYQLCALLVLGIYLALNVAFLRVVSIQEMAGDPFVAASVATRRFGSTGDTVVRVLTVVSLLATVNAVVLMASRVPFAMSRVGLMPSFLQRVNRGGTPAPALFAGTAGAGLHYLEQA
jgi:hypothetical protein